jgi:hypothetical protein
MDILENYESAPEAAKRLGIDHSRVVRLCQQGRIRDAVRTGEGPGSRWFVPKDAWPTRSRFGPKGTWEESRPESQWVESVPGA